MVMASKHVVVLSVIITFMFFGVIGTCCMDGACGGDLDAWAYVGYFGWVLALMATCVGIITSQGGSGSMDLNEIQAAKELALAAME